MLLYIHTLRGVGVKKWYRLELIKINCLNFNDIEYKDKQELIKVANNQINNKTLKTIIKKLKNNITLLQQEKKVIFFILSHCLYFNNENIQKLLIKDFSKALSIHSHYVKYIVNDYYYNNML